jgi:hypothetical protein
MSRALPGFRLVNPSREQCLRGTELAFRGVDLVPHGNDFGKRNRVGLERAREPLHRCPNLTRVPHLYHTLIIKTGCDTYRCGIRVADVARVVSSAA